MKMLHFFILVGISLTLASCDSVFSTSLASGLKRDSENVYKNVSTSDIISMAETARGEERKELLSELGKRSIEELKGLSSTEKESILRLSTDTTLSVEAITNTINTITETGGDFSSIDTVEFMDTIFESLPQGVDTKALQVLLSDDSDTSVVKTGSQDTVLLSTLALLAQTAKNDPAINSSSNMAATMNGIREEFQTISDWSDPGNSRDIAEKALGDSVSEDTIAAVETMVNVISILYDANGGDLSGLNIMGLDISGFLGLSA